MLKDRHNHIATLRNWGDIMIEQEKQIEEMAKDIYEYGRTYNDCVYKCEEDIAEYLITEKSYRKERRGEWVSIGRLNGKKVCSNCKYPQPYKKIKAGYHLLDDVKYCPNCGARMKGE